MNATQTRITIPSPTILAALTKTALEQQETARHEAKEKRHKERIAKAEKLLEELKASFVRKAPLAAQGGDQFGIGIYDGCFIYTRGWYKEIGSLTKMEYLSYPWIGREDHIPIAVYRLGRYLQRKKFKVRVIEYDSNFGLLFKW